MEFIEQVRVGSHNVFHARDDKGHGWNETVTDYKTIYHDCLVSKEWLEAHKDFQMPEQTCDITVNGETKTFNASEYKGEIKEYMDKFTVKMRVGRKVQRVIPGSQVLNMGGGLHIVMSPEQLEREHKEARELVEV